jgi:asparagine synthase (glutamine-hydrolysing)
MSYFDEPFSDSSALPTHVICAKARKDFTVVLSGDAGDEVFGGYKNHVRAWQWRHFDKLPRKWRKPIGSLFASISPEDSLPRRFFNRLGQPVGRFGLGGMGYPFQDWQAACLKPEFQVSPDRIVKLYDDYLPRWEKASSIDLAQRTDLRSYMVDDILIKVDRMSMRNSLEVRSPFLDYRIVELGLSVPSRLRVKNGTNKYLLRRLAARHLPEQVVVSPKRGFGIPLRSWLHHDGLQCEMLYALHRHQTGILNPFVGNGVEKLWRKEETNPALTSTLFMFLSYYWWCKKRGEYQ